MNPSNSPDAPDFEAQARRLLARYAEGIPSDTGVEAQVRARLAAQTPSRHAASHWTIPRFASPVMGDWARGAISLGLVIILIAGFVSVLRLRGGATPGKITTGAQQGQCATVEPDHTIKLCSGARVQASIVLGQSYADPTRTEVEVHLDLTNPGLRFSDSGSLTQPDSVNVGETILQDGQGHLYAPNNFSMGFNYGQEHQPTVYGPDTPTPGFFAFDPLPQTMLRTPQTLTLRIAQIAVMYNAHNWLNTLFVNGPWTFTFQVTPQAGRSVTFHVAPQTYGGITVQPLRLDIGPKGNNFDYLGGGARLVVRVSGLPPDIYRSTVAAMPFKYFNSLGAGAGGSGPNAVLFEGRLPASIAGMMYSSSPAEDPLIGPSGSVDLEVIYLGLPKLTGTQTLTLDQVAVTKSGSPPTFVKGNWSFELPLG